jgi:hypothetical protein
VVLDKLALALLRGRTSMDERLDRVFEGLSATFDAAVAREEDIAASDLAFSLAQDRTIAELLQRRAGALLLDGQTRFPVTAVGNDYLMTEDPTTVVPLARAVVVADARGRPADVRRGGMVALLRSWARAGACVQVGTPQGVFSGRIVRASTDHLCVCGRREIAVALGAVRWVRVARAGSADVP